MNRIDGDAEFGAYTLPMPTARIYALVLRLCHEPRGCSMKLVVHVQIPFEPVSYLGCILLEQWSPHLSMCLKGIEMSSLAIMYTIKFERGSQTRMVR